LSLWRVLVGHSSRGIGHGTEAALAVYAGVVGIDRVCISRIVDGLQPVQRVVGIGDRDSLGVGFGQQVPCRVIGIGCRAGIRGDDLVYPAVMTIRVPIAPTLTMLVFFVFYIF